MAETRAPYNQQTGLAVIKTNGSFPFVLDKMQKFIKAIHQKVPLLSSQIFLVCLLFL